MTQTLYIHIGLPKTGTTSLQFFMHRNKAALKARGIYYPATMRDPHPTATQHRYVNEAMREQQRRAKEGHPVSSHVINRMLHEIEKQEFPVNVISEELFSWEPSFAAPFLANFRSKVDAKVVVFLRRQDTWCESMYAQSIRGGYREPFTHFMNARPTTERIDYRHFLTTWADAFGKENIIARPYVDRETQTHLEMLSIIGVPDFEFEGTEQRNPSLTGEAIAFILGIEGLTRTNYPKLNRLFGTQLAEITKKGSPVFFTPEARTEFLASYQDINDWVVREFLGEDPATKPLFKADPASFPSADRVVAPLSAERRIELLKLLIAGEDGQRPVSDDASKTTEERIESLTAQLDRICIDSTVDV